MQRKQALTPGEREQEEEADIIDDHSDEDEDDGTIYNPKNLPLGWDGKVHYSTHLNPTHSLIYLIAYLYLIKPIPYWLYKLHGLNLYYNCEICGNHKYRGPKAFQQHFSEWRHAHGMRCLGIPNTAHFANITLIEDAAQLWDKLRNNREQDRFDPTAQVNIKLVSFGL